MPNVAYVDISVKNVFDQFHVNKAHLLDATQINWCISYIVIFTDFVITVRKGQ